MAAGPAEYLFEILHGISHFDLQPNHPGTLSSQVFPPRDSRERLPSVVIFPDPDETY